MRVLPTVRSMLALAKARIWQKKLILCHWFLFEMAGYSKHTHMVIFSACRSPPCWECAWIVFQPQFIGCRPYGNTFRMIRKHPDRFVRQRSLEGLGASQSTIAVSANLGDHLLFSDWSFTRSYEVTNWRHSVSRNPMETGLSQLSERNKFWSSNNPNYPNPR